MEKYYGECDMCPIDINLIFSAPSRLGIQEQDPRIGRSSSLRNQSLHDNSFAVISPRVWNTLSGNLHNLAGMENLKNNLADNCNSIPDNPPVSGYKCANGNSLFDWKLA